MNDSSRAVLVTGASRGIGLEIARTLSDKSYRLHLLTGGVESADALRHETFVRETGATVHALDLLDRTQIADFCAGWHDPLWGIVNNAGICKTLDLKASADDPLDEVLATNLIGPYLLTKGLLSCVSRPGRIVNIASQLGQEGRAGYAAYCASKFGLIGMTKCWAKELGAEGITVNAVCPGWVDTEMSRTDMVRLAAEKGSSPEAYYDEICAPLELRRFNSTGEVASLVSYLMSDDAAGITGRDWLMQTIWNQN